MIPSSRAEYVRYLTDALANADAAYRQATSGPSAKPKKATFWSARRELLQAELDAA